MPRDQGPRSISLIGAGRVGSTLTTLLQRRRHRILSVISRRPAAARSLAKLVRARKASSSVRDIARETDLVIIAVPDESIAEVSYELSRSAPLVWSRTAVFHPSGVLTHDALSDVAACGATTFSLHPIQTFPQQIKPRQQLELMKGVWYGFEGEDHARGLASRLVRDLGGRMVSIPKEAKLLYHVACVFASNYTVAVLGAAHALALKAGLPGLEPLQPLIETSVRLTLSGDPKDILTGPVARGSVRTIRAHVNGLSVEEPLIGDAYKVIGMLALELVKQRGGLDEKRIRELTDILRR
ncbi:MAG: DUF2520 domain-containing protein [Ignavibacteriales bacterium]|nr:DUF2520 domain-containing protein [Ignavibacteriales bacterium]